MEFPSEFFYDSPQNTDYSTVDQIQSFSNNICGYCSSDNGNDDSDDEALIRPIISHIAILARDVVLAFSSSREGARSEAPSKGGTDSPNFRGSYRF